MEKGTQLTKAENSKYLQIAAKENGKYIIVAGNVQATPNEYDTIEEAQKAIPENSDFTLEIILAFSYLLNKENNENKNS